MPSEDLRTQMRSEAPWSWGLKAGAILLLTVLAYVPALRSGFIWDDDTFLWNNPLIKSPDGLFRFWFSTEAPDYFPLTSTSLWLEWRLWGEHAAGYHFTNVLLHASSAVLWWRILARLKLPLAWLAAMIFALHPVNVESVAWITERKNTLAMFFYGLALLSYLRFADTGATKAYWLGLLAFVLALLSKTSVVMLPVVLLGIAWWQRGRVERKDILRSLPFFAVALLFGIVTLWFQSHRAIGAMAVRDDSFWSRLAGAGWAVWFYGYKALVPLKLCFVYPRWQIDSSRLWVYGPGLVLLIAAGLGWRFRQSWGRGCLLGLGYFVALLLPVLGFANIFFMRYSLVADHWQYFAIIAPIAGGLAWAYRFKDSWLGKSRAAQVGLAGMVLVGLGALTWQRAGVYRSVEMLWLDTLAKNPDCWLARAHYGNLLKDRGQSAEAETQYRLALEAKPDYADAWFDLGELAYERSQLDAAVEFFQKGLRSSPTDADAHNSLGVILSQQQKFTEAVAQFEQAIQSNPGDARTWNHYGLTLVAMGALDQAVAHYQQALKLNPDLADAHCNLGAALAQLKRNEEAMGEYRRALELNPQHADAHNNLGSALADAGKLGEALVEYREALRINPNHGGAHNNLGIALVHRGELEAATEQFRVAVREKPGDGSLRENLGNVLLMREQFDEAVEQYQSALRLAPTAQAHFGLGSTLARLGRRQEAVAEFREALKLNPEFEKARERLKGLER